MGKIEYDFRLGSNQDRIVYRNDKWNWRSLIYYILYMLFAWLYAVGWFAIFEYSYINHQRIAFWTYIGCWLIFMAIFISFAIKNLVKAEYKRKQKIAKIRMIEDELRRREEEENRQREEMRNPQRRMTSEAAALFNH